MLTYIGLVVGPITILGEAVVQKDEINNLLLDRADGLRRGLPRQTIKNAVAEKLGALIASGVMDVGDELPSERELAAALSISRETVRGAIQVLAAHGVLEVVQGARTRVISADLGSMNIGITKNLNIEDYDLESVHSARLLVEREVAGAAAERMVTSTLDRLEKSLAAQNESLTDPVRFLICDREFHVTIYRSCGNPLLADIATDLYSYLMDYRRRVVSQPNSIQSSINDHRKIYEALAAHDRDAAIRAFSFHEERIYKSTRRLLSSDQA